MLGEVDTANSMSAVTRPEAVKVGNTQKALYRAWDLGRPIIYFRMSVCAHASNTNKTVIFKEERSHIDLIVQDAANLRTKRDF